MTNPSEPTGVSEGGWRTSESPDIKTVLVTWDSEANATYVYLTPKDEWPEFCYQEDVHGDASLVLDYAYYDDRWVLGIEMLTPPVGKDGTVLSAHGWVIASKAWERTHIPQTPSTTMARFSTSFLMDAGGPIYVG